MLLPNTPIILAIHLLPSSELNSRCFIDCIWSLYVASGRRHRTDILARHRQACLRQIAYFVAVFVASLCWSNTTQIKVVPAHDDSRRNVANTSEIEGVSPMPNWFILSVRPSVHRYKALIYINAWRFQMWTGFAKEKKHTFVFYHWLECSFEETEGPQIRSPRATDFLERKSGCNTKKLLQSKHEWRPKSLFLQSSRASFYGRCPNLSWAPECPISWLQGSIFDATCRYSHWRCRC